MTPLKRLLTSDLLPDGQPLFATATELAHSIAAGSSRQYKNPKTALSLLSFVLRGERACSAQLRSALLAASRRRLSKQPKPVQDEWIHRVGRAVDAFNASLADSDKRQSPPDEVQFDSLLAIARKAEHHFIITPATAEQEADSQRADELNKLLIERLHVTERGDYVPDTKYEFLLPNEHTATQFWQRLAEKAAKQADDLRSVVNQNLERLDKENFLAVYVVPSFACGCPIVVFEPGKRSSTAFSFGYHSNNVIDTIQWDDRSIVQWEKIVYELFERVGSKSVAHRKELEQLEHPSKVQQFFGYRHRFKAVANDRNGESK
ncbi:MAG TPA: hypothetical protein VGW57_07635 [Chthoniobacterales bacterium]|nr:hypothetical protein [Chthoniobacterales bacterium]